MIQGSVLFHVRLLPILGGVAPNFMAASSSGFSQDGKIWIVPSSFYLRKAIFGVEISRCQIDGYLSFLTGKKAGDRKCPVLLNPQEM
jgi:hypothetical protein